MVNAEIEKLINDTISANKVAVFSKSYCPYCKMAKGVFDSIKVAYFAIELDQREDGNDIQAGLLAKTGSKTVPQVFVNGNFIGGGTDVKQLHENNKLLPLLAN